jgi:hypothetical protein
MKRFPKRGFIITILFIFLLFSPILLLADPSDPWCNPYGLYPDGTPCPIDSKLYILLAFGVLYGIKKVKDFRKQASKEDRM